MAGAPILVVDDAVTNLKMIRMALSHEGHEVRTAERAEEALEMLSDYRPELILADIQLPGMNGLQMARIVKENPRTSGIKVLAFTAFVGSETRERALRAGCDDFLCKPIDTSTLAAKVRELLARTGRKQAEFVEAAAAETIVTAPVPRADPMEQRFLSDSSETCLQLLNSLKDEFDSNHAREQLHQWARQARLFGHPEIRVLAERGERLLLQGDVSMPELREVFTDLFLAFAELLQKKVGNVADSFLQATAGKRIGLVGFTQRQADLACTVLTRLKSVPLVFEAADCAGVAAVANCDLAIVHVREENLGSAWLTPNQSDAGTKNMVLLGNRQDLTALPAQIWAQAADFVLETNDPEHLLLRLGFAISRGQRPSPSVQTNAVPAAPAPVPVRPRTAVNSPSLVLADDDEIIRILTSSLLKNHGMTCRSAANGLDALRLIRSEQPAVAVLDVNMPGMSGFEVLAAIRAEKLPCHVMLLTAREQEEDIVRGFDLGADDYLVKPFNPFEFVARLKRFLR